MASIKSRTYSKGILNMRLLWVAVMIVIAFTVVTTSTLLSITTVSITANGQTLSVQTRAKTVGELLNKQEIVLEDKDEVFPPTDFPLKKNQVVIITRAFPVTVNVDGEAKEFKTTGKFVKDFLSANGIILTENDVVNPELDSTLSLNAVINVVRVKNENIVEQKTIPFETVSKPNSTIERGKTKVVQEGKNGTKELVYTVVKNDGKEVSRELVGERVVKEPVNKITQYGTKYMQLTSRGGSVADIGSLSYSRVLVCNASAYDLSYASTGKRPGDKGYGVTAAGMVAKRGVVAVDPRVIPLGTRLYIQSLDGSADYGYAVAGDTGGGIKGNKVDLFMNSRAEATKFGRRNVKVYILN